MTRVDLLRPQGKLKDNLHVPLPYVPLPYFGEERTKAIPRLRMYLVLANLVVEMASSGHATRSRYGRGFTCRHAYRHRHEGSFNSILPLQAQKPRTPKADQPKPALI